MEAPIVNTDFLIQDLWHWLSEIEICHHELQDCLLKSAGGKIAEYNEDLFVDGMCFISSLERSKGRLQNEVVKAARDFCQDSVDEYPSLQDVGAWEVGSDKNLVSFLNNLRVLISEVKERMNTLRIQGEKISSLKINEKSVPKLMWKDGKWVKTYHGKSVEDPNSNSLNELGRLKRDFDKQTANILVLENERNVLALRVEKLELQLGKRFASRK